MKPGGPLDWLLRIIIFAEFLGHGILALQQKPDWILWWSQIFQVSEATSAEALIYIGIGDLVLAGLVLFLPWRLFLIKATIWATIVVFGRLLAGVNVWEAIAHPSFGPPLALLLLRGLPRQWSDWLR